MNELQEVLKQLSQNQPLLENMVFPNKDELKNNYAQTNFKILIEQGQLLIKRNLISTTKITENDYIYLEKLFIEDIQSFLTKYHESLDIKLDILTFGQTKLPSDTLYHIVNSRIFKDSYKTIDLLSQDDTYNMYSLPFLIRITIETQIKSIIGFEKIKKATLPLDRTIDFLIKHNSLVSIDTTTFENIKNIWSWSSAFVHTGEKEPIWLTLKALQQVKSLFKHKERSTQYMSYPLNYLEIEIEDFQEKINTYLYPNDKNEIELNRNNFEIKNKFYNSTEDKWISPY